MGEGKTILVVDDDADFRGTMGFVIEELGYRAASADSPQALDEAAACQADVILLDYRMSPLDGPEVKRLLRADPRTSHIPIVLVTGCADAEDVAREMGLRYSLSKPFGIKRLERTIHTVLEGTQS